MDFSCKELQTDVLQIQDKAGNCSTLVTGSERALLFDTMIGLGDLKRFVEARTKLPLIVVNSHGHMDHMGGNFQFEKVYLHPRDFSLIPIDLENVTVRGEHMGVCLENCRRSLENTGNICALEEGTEFDLGNLKVKVLALPGHTGGSIGLLLPEKRLLLAGDACTPQMCLYMDGSESLEVYRETLRKLEKEPFDSFVLGHFMKLFPKGLLKRFQECADQVGNGKGREFQYSLIPRYKGTLYFRDIYNQEADGPICIIVKEGM